MEQQVLACGDARYCPGMCTRPSNVRVPRVGRVLIAILSLWGTLAITLCALLNSFPASPATLDRVYGTLGIYATIWQVYFGVDAVLSENEFQYAAMHGTSVAFTAFVVWNVFHNATSLGPLWSGDDGAGRYAVLGVVLAFQVALFALALPVWRSFGFFAYKVVGASIPLKTAFKRYRAFLSLVKYDFFASTTLLILARFYLPDMHPGAPEFRMSVAALVASVLFALLAWYSITHEQLVPSALAAVAAAFEPAFIGYELFVVYGGPGGSELPAGVTPGQFVVLGTIALGVRVALIICAALCVRNFGKGLHALFKRGAEGGTGRGDAGGSAVEGSRLLGLGAPLLSGGEGAAAHPSMASLNSSSHAAGPAAVQPASVGRASTAGAAATANSRSSRWGWAAPAPLARTDTAVVDDEALPAADGWGFVAPPLLASPQSDAV